MNWKSLLLILVFSVSCIGGGGGGSSSGGSSSVSFNGSGSISIDDIVDDGSKSTSALYYGRFAYYDGTNLYGGAIHFTINKQDNSSAYFSDFYLDSFARLDTFTSSTSIVSSSENLNISVGYGSSTNSVTISSSTSRFVDMNMDFGNNTHFGDVVNAGVVFSSDLSTMVGGDDDTFFFIAQKASSQPASSIANVKASWSIFNFTVSAGGTIYADSTSSVSVSGTGGNGYTAFTGNNSVNGYFDGEISLADSPSGLFIFGYGIGSGTPTATAAAGLFLMSTDNRFVLGIDVTDGTYFAGWK